MMYLLTIITNDNHMTSVSAKCITRACSDTTVQSYTRSYSVHWVWIAIDYNMCTYLEHNCLVQCTDNTPL